MRIEIVDYQDRWQLVKNAAMGTIGKESGKYPDSAWKRSILLAEHSPIRLLEFDIIMHDIPYWVSVHLVRHKTGVEHFVSTQRTDRTGVDRDSLPQDAPVTHRMHINAQALIAISRKRLCHQAADKTRYVWADVVRAIREYEPELADACVPECVYRGFCPEMRSCGFVNGKTYERVRGKYVGSNQNQVSR